MAILSNFYKDIKDETHCVEHLTLPSVDPSNRERIIEELMNALSRNRREVHA